MSAGTSKPLRGASVPSPSAGPLPQPLPARVDLPNPHLGYAITWYGLALAWIAFCAALAAPWMVSVELAATAASDRSISAEIERMLPACSAEVEANRRRRYAEIEELEGLLGGSPARIAATV